MGIPSNTVTAAVGAGTNRISSGTTSVVTSNASGGSITFNTGGSQRMMIDGSGSVGIGTSSPGSALVIMNNGTSDDSRDDLSIYSYSPTANNTPAYIALEARGTTSSPSPLLSGDHLGGLNMEGFNGTNFNYNAMIVGIAESNLASSGDVGIAFSTTASGTTSGIQVQSERKCRNRHDVHSGKT